MSSLAIQFDLAEKSLKLEEETMLDSAKYFPFGGAFPIIKKNC
jgi:uncharacterized protein (UPF0303 family)